MLACHVFIVVLDIMSTYTYIHIYIHFKIQSYICCASFYFGMVFVGVVEFCVDQAPVMYGKLNTVYV